MYASLSRCSSKKAFAYEASPYMNPESIRIAIPLWTDSWGEVSSYAAARRLSHSGIHLSTSFRPRVRPY